MALVVSWDAYHRGAARGMSSIGHFGSFGEAPEQYGFPQESVRILSIVAPAVLRLPFLECRLLPTH